VSLFGHTRAHVAVRHALITPDNHVPSSLPGFDRAAAAVLINPALGAGLAQVLVTFEARGRAAPALCDNCTFGYFLEGGATLTLAAKSRRCRLGHYFFAPPRQAWSVENPKPGTKLLLFQKRYAPLAGAGLPRVIAGEAARVASKPHLGDPAVRLQALLPDEPAFDWGVDILRYEPGAHLPTVEVHAMEHGLLMLEGQGICRLEDDWYPVRSGDAIWMAPYCAQWFVAMGKAPAAYLYCKDINRAAL
jgi:(S)-ureidoglycine aminohydrolase